MTDVLVVPYGDDHAVVVGASGGVNEVGETESVVPEHLTRAILSAIGALPALGLELEGASGRLVRLTGESAQKLAASSDKSLGVLRGQDGQFNHVLRLDPTNAVQAAAVMSLVSALAMQAQLAHISRQLDALSEEVGALRRDSQIAEEAEVAASLVVLDRLANRVQARTAIDGDDWDSLSDLEHQVTSQYFRAIAHLGAVERRLGGGRSVPARLRALASVVRREDLDFWLRLHVHAELAAARWDDLYLQYEATVAPDGLDHALERVRANATTRLEALRRAQHLAEDCVALAGEDASLWDRIFHPVARRHLEALERQLIGITGAYAVMLGQTNQTVSEQTPGPGAPSLVHQTTRALGQASDEVGDLLRRIGKRSKALLKRGDDDSGGQDEEDAP